MFGIEVHLVLAHEAADAGHLSHAGDGFELVAQVPVLQRAQVGQAPGVAAVHDGVLVDPAGAGGVRADGRMHVRRKLARDLLQVFDHARPRPVEIGAILKDDEDIRVAEHGLRAHALHVGRRQQRGHDRICDLIFDHVRWLARPRSCE